MTSRTTCVALAGLLFGAAGAASAGSLEPSADGYRTVRIDGASAAVSVYEHAGRVSRVYGRAFSRGATPEASASAFLDRNAALFGVDRADLAPIGRFEDGRHLQPIMPHPATGASTFTGVYYTQWRDGVPVFRGEAVLLVRNEANHPLVLVSADLRDLGGFRPGDVRDLADGRAAAGKTVPDLDVYSNAEPVIFAGVDDVPHAPVLAATFTGESGVPADADYAKWLFVTDARTGAVLYHEDQVLQVDFEGNVSGRATEWPGPEDCEEESPAPMPYARVILGGQGVEAFADENGDYVIPFEGENQQTVISAVRGRWFRVFNNSGPDTLLDAVVTPPGPANFMHNDANTDEFIRAEVNGYVQSNIVRDFSLVQNPDYPVIGTQEEFTVNVNLSGSCNGFYTGTSINFLVAGDGCPNTAFSSVIHHEYGHHLVQTGGSGQGAYGEGMSDTMSVLVLDDPGVGYGFTGGCDDPFRTADNDIQYPCQGPIHECGQLLSGCVWETRNALFAKNPSTYREIISRLAVNAILLHVGSGITPAITIDYLTLDDNDEDISNGTPNYCEIAAGFGAHNMDAPPAGCAADFDEDDDIDFDDLLMILAAWGPCEDCPEDLNNDDQVGFDDLLLLLTAWGECSCD